MARVLPPAVADHYRAQQRLTVATLGLTRREWASMGVDFDTSWATVGPRLVLLTSSAQLGAARSGAGYIPTALEQQRIRVSPDGEVDPRRFAGVASDGRPLDSLLYGAVVEAKTQVAQGAAPADALAVGGRTLDMYVHTMVADAARQAASVAISARPRVGWVRMVNPPCCGRCAALAGKFFRHNEGFERHPRCDCTHVPTTEGGAQSDLTTNPRPDQIKGLTDGQRKALDDGADIGQVINADRRVLVNGRYVSRSSGMTTTEGTSRRGFARSRLGAGRQRLTPDAIYDLSSTRDETLALLKRNGYLL